MKKSAIIEALFKLEEECDITILYSSEVGSRVYGFALPDSDFDVKFIFMRKESEYLRIRREAKDVITVSTKIDNITVDFCGWEITKFLTLMYDGNYSTFEWTTSPYTYLTRAKFVQYMGEINKYFIPYRAVMAYKDHAKGMRKEMKYEDAIPIKKYLHAIDAILNARMCNSVKVPPTLNMRMKLYLIKDDDVLNKVLFLMSARSNGTEYIEPVPELDTYIDNAITGLNIIIQKWEDKRDSAMKYSTIDEIFYNLVKGSN